MMIESDQNLQTARATEKSRATFFGTAFHKVSGRNQVNIPRQHKRAMDEAKEDQLFLLHWQNEPFLRLYTKSEFDRKLDAVKKDSGAANVERISRRAEFIEPDSQGRFVLPGKWIEALNIKEEIAFCGAFNYIKIWPAEAVRDSEKKEVLEPAAAEKITATLDD